MYIHKVQVNQCTLLTSSATCLGKKCPSLGIYVPRSAPQDDLFHTTRFPIVDCPILDACARLIQQHCNKALLHSRATFSPSSFTQLGFECRVGGFRWLMGYVLKNIHFWYNFTWRYKEWGLQSIMPMLYILFLKSFRKILPASIFLVVYNLHIKVLETVAHKVRKTFSTSSIRS